MDHVPLLVRVLSHLVTATILFAGAVLFRLLFELMGDPMAHRWLELCAVGLGSLFTFLFCFFPFLRLLGYVAFFVVLLHGFWAFLTDDPLAGDRTRPGWSLLLYPYATGAVLWFCCSSFLCDWWDWLERYYYRRKANRPRTKDEEEEPKDRPTIVMWEAATGNQLVHWDGHAAAFSADGKLLATGDGFRIRIWETATSNQVLVREHREKVRSVTFSPDGSLLVSVTDGSICLWKVGTGTQLQERENESSAHRVVFAPDGGLLTGVRKEHTIGFWEAHDDDLGLDRDDGNWAWSWTLSPDGKLIASAGSDRTVRLFDVATGKEVRALEGYEGTIYSVTFSPDGKSLAGGEGHGYGDDCGRIHVWDVVTGKPLIQLDGDLQRVRSVAFSPDGSLLASGEGSHGMGHIHLWDATSGKRIRELAAHEFYCDSLDFSPDGRVLVSAGEEELALWEVATGRELFRRELHPFNAHSVTFSPDGSTIVATGTEYR